MKKIFLLVLPLVLFSCTNNPYEHLETQMKAKVLEDTFEGKLKKYKTLGVSIMDTITIADSLEVLLEDIHPYANAFEKDLDSFKEHRNREFRDFRYRQPNYEEDVMRGKLKDASAWCTEIRVITETADSLIANWDKVSIYDYEYVYLNFWYSHRLFSFYDMDNKHEAKEYLDEIISLKDAFLKYKELSKMPKNEVLYYNVEYKYSFFNPLLDCEVFISNIARFTPDWILIDMESSDFGFN